MSAVMCGAVERRASAACLVSGTGLNYIEAAPQGRKLGEPLHLDAIRATAPQALLA